MVLAMRFISAEPAYQPAPITNITILVSMGGTRIGGCGVATLSTELAEKLEQLRAWRLACISPLPKLTARRAEWTQLKIYKPSDSALPPRTRLDWLRLEGK